MSLEKAILRRYLETPWMAGNLWRNLNEARESKDEILHGFSNLIFNLWFVYEETGDAGFEQRVYVLLEHFVATRDGLRLHQEFSQRRRCQR